MTFSDCIIVRRSDRGCQARHTLEYKAKFEWQRALGLQRFMIMRQHVFSIQRTSEQNYELRILYYSMVEASVRGEFERMADFLRDFRKISTSGSGEFETVRRLLSIRLAMKRGVPPLEEEWLNLAADGESWLSAEKCFVQGQLHYHCDRFAAGVVRFKEAEERFKKLEMLDRLLPFGIQCSHRRNLR